VKLLIDQSQEYEDVTITIQCGRIDARLQQLISQIRLYSFTLIGKKDGRSYVIPVEEVCYFESVDDTAFLYTESDVLEAGMKLYEIEEQLSGTGFVRVSKSCILNTEKLLSVRPMLNGKYEAELKSGEKVLVSRHYIPEFKRIFGL